MALYRYFTSKADLLRALGEVAMTEAELTVSAAIADEPSARARLRIATESFIDYWEARPARFRLFYMTPETMEPETATQMVKSPNYRRSVALAASLSTDLIAEVGGDRKKGLLARDLHTALMVGYLHSRIINVRFPWHDFKALRQSVIETIVAGVEQCVRKSK